MKILLLVGALLLVGCLAAAEPDRKQVYCVIPSLTSPDVRPVVLPLQELDLGLRRIETLQGLWRYLQEEAIDVVLSAELGANLSAERNGGTGKRSSIWDSSNGSTVALEPEAAKGMQQLMIMTAAINAFERATKVDVHFEPLSLVSLAYPRWKERDRVTLILSEGDEKAVKEAARRVMATLAQKSFVSPPKAFPSDVAELWKMYLRTEDDKEVEVLGYSSSLNILLLRTSSRWMNDFLIGWESAGG